jgi:hypothetical protein
LENPHNSQEMTELKLKNMYWLMNKKSELSVENKLTTYKAILKTVWTCGIKLLGCSKTSNTKILQTYQLKTLRMITGAPWFVSNLTLHSDLKIPFIHEEITSCQQIQTTYHWPQQPASK